jgi:hypothetical protein
VTRNYKPVGEEYQEEGGDAVNAIFRFIQTLSVAVNVTFITFILM